MKYEVEARWEQQSRTFTVEAETAENAKAFVLMELGRPRRFTVGVVDRPWPRILENIEFTVTEK